MEKMFPFGIMKEDYFLTTIMDNCMISKNDVILVTRPPLLTFI
jgi:hypothetical protein